MVAPAPKRNALAEIFTARLEDLGPEEILVVAVHSCAARRTLHDYLDVAFPHLGHVSIVCPGLINSHHYTVLLKECYHCGHKKVPLNTYRFGDMENNKDESYHGDCSGCGWGCSWEPNYDSRSNVVYVPERNIMVIGALLRPFEHRKWQVDKSKDQLCESIGRIQTMQQFITLALNAESRAELDGFNRNAKRLVRFVTARLPPASWAVK